MTELGWHSRAICAPVVAPLWCYLRLARWLWGDEMTLTVDDLGSVSVAGDPERAREVFAFMGVALIVVVLWAALVWFPAVLPAGVWQLSLVGLAVWLPVALMMWADQLTITSPTEGDDDDAENGAAGD